MSKSKIEWTDATWNPVTGCTKVSQGCKNCYAEREWHRLTHLPRFKGREFTDVQCHDDRLRQPLHWRKPRKIFVCHNSDLFHESVPFDFIKKVFLVMGDSRHHTYQVLTKRPERAVQFFNWSWARVDSDAMRDIYPHVWLGVSVEDQATADERIPLLLQVPAAVRWLSVEPLLSHIDLTMALEPFYSHDPLLARNHSPVQWIVVGGESGPKARPMHPDWARTIRDQCIQSGVPFFFKQWGNLLPHCQADVPRLYYPKKVVVPSPSNPQKNNIYYKVGKKLAGNLLDGKKWEQYPNEQ